MTAVMRAEAPATEIEAAVVRPAMTLAEAKAVLQQMREFRQSVLVKGTDYGELPGVAKPTLFKSGAEKLANIFALSIEHQILEKVEDWERGFFAYTMRAIARSRRDGAVVADCIASCNSLEDKYRYRTVFEWDATPEDKQAAVKVRTRRKKKGSGTYRVYLLPNTEPFSLVNTIQKMAQKRAMVGAVLIATRASEEYTQDVEDLPDTATEAEEPAGAPPATDADGVVLEPTTAEQVTLVFAEAAKAGLTKETFPAWYADVCKRPWAGTMYEIDVKPLLDAAAGRMAERGKARAAAGSAA